MVTEGTKLIHLDFLIHGTCNAISIGFIKVKIDGGSTLSCRAFSRRQVCQEQTRGTNLAD